MDHDKIKALAMHAMNEIVAGPTCRPIEDALRKAYYDGGFDTRQQLREFLNSYQPKTGDQSVVVNLLLNQLRDMEV